MKELQLSDILKNTSDLQEKKVWYVAVIGRPNVWKSTFLNTLIGEKVSITSKVPQTTRNKIPAIYNDPESQIIFFDTPGIHESTKSFNAEINNQALSSLRDSELILYFIDSSRPTWEEEAYIEKLLKDVTTPVVRVYTKSDIQSKRTQEMSEDDFLISSVTQDGFWDLLEAIQSYLPTWPMLFPEDFYTKQDTHFRIAEIIREKLFQELREELPHSVFVWVEEIDDSNPELLKIVAYVYSETDSQKYIIIGKNGSLISKVGKQARLELEDIFGTKVFLALRAKTKKWWRKDEKFIKKMLQK